LPDAPAINDAIDQAYRRGDDVLTTRLMAEKYAAVVRLHAERPAANGASR
jgi:hypothetical protein